MHDTAAYRMHIACMQHLNPNNIAKCCKARIFNPDKRVAVKKIEIALLLNVVGDA